MTDEHGYINGVHRNLDRQVYRWKTNVRFHRGIPDAYYSGCGGDIWIEYKYISNTPRRAFTADLTPHQRRWLNARRQEGRHVAVIVGTPAGGTVLLDGAWNHQQRVPPQWLSYAEVALWIEQQTLSISTPATSAAPSAPS